MKEGRSTRPSRSDADRESRRFERRLAHSPEKVWRALTEAEHLAAWFPAAVSGEPANDAELRFDFPEDSEPSVLGRVTEWDPPRVLAYRMGDETLRWELFPSGEGCVLVLTTESAAGNDGLQTRMAA